MFDREKIKFYWLIIIALFVPVASDAYISPSLASESVSYTAQEFMIPMHDGVRLQTIVIRSFRDPRALPILLTRTPYGIPTEKSFNAVLNGERRDRNSWRELAADGYIFVWQNIRGRFGSEGIFDITSRYDPTGHGGPNETDDAYDTIDWLVKNVPNNNGQVGMYGVSYEGLTAALSLLHPHPALKAISEQAASVDQWMNDDTHRYGALRESYAFEYSILEETDRNKNSIFDFDEYDTYEWYIKLGALSNANAKYLHSTLSFWNDIVTHPDYDDFWKRQAWLGQLSHSKIPNLNVAGFWDQEDPWGPWKLFRHVEELGSNDTDFMVAGPWYHGQWQGDGTHIGLLPFGEHDTSAEFRREIEAPFFRYYLHGEGEKPVNKISIFETGSNSWRHYSEWPPKSSVPTNLYLHSDGSLSFAPPHGDVSEFREYVSDPSNPVPYRQRPISPTFIGGEGWPTWEMADQRFVDHRPDVLSFVSEPLEHDLTVAGQITTELYASSSGTDSDFVVKLIDIFPQSNQKSTASSGQDKRQTYADSMNGYELPIAMEIRRGRYLNSFEHAAPIIANKPELWEIPLRDHDHVFLKGHRIMLQVQSTWFPVIDRNPQRFVQSIYQAKPEDYISAIQRIYSSPERPSHVILPITP
ncbi:hypothetical protein HNQ77_005351 [Silvibacterium bohemicum]|uniref:Xaa-Pro dipeptidyl-peptidase C-terminal domain-containing protein n=1 Tax=Silvibacterium bohemicum TaxID=1577686 RepID=A0A841K2V4_9BACT|nr:CocE/NonD family hydrolase [Silvibacterium bohemicum]MBB6147355.1 hypothetical protein [Silvibacterium bohemicum]